jgi:hypothetical protein
VDEQQLRRHLDEAHRQLLDRDNTYRFHEDELRSRDRQLELLREQLRQLRKELADAQGWARELEASIQAMQRTRTWRLAERLRALLSGPRKILRR